MVDNTVGKALVLFAFNKGCALTWQAPMIMAEVIVGKGGETETFDLETIGATVVVDPGVCQGYPSGLFMTKLKFKRGEIIVFDLKPATVEEWEAYRDHRWPWKSLA